MRRSSAAPTVPAAAEGGWSCAPGPDGTPIAWRLDAPAPTAAAAAPATTVVLCNGIGCTDSQWSRVVPELARTHPVVRWHYRGHGRSGSPADRRSRVDVAAVADDLRAVLRAAAAPRVVLVGHSFGVQVALEAARTERVHVGGAVAGVVAVAGAAGHPLSRAQRAGEALLAQLELMTAAAPDTTTRLWRELWRSPLTSVIARGLRGTSALTPRQALLDYCVHVSGLDVELLTRMFRGMQDHSAFDLLDVLDVPLLCVAGTADGFTPLAVMADMARRAPHGHLEVVPAAAHTLPVERPQALLAALRRFLGQLDASPAGVPVAPAQVGAA